MGVSYASAMLERFRLKQNWKVHHSQRKSTKKQQIIAIRQLSHTSIVYSENETTQLILFVKGKVIPYLHKYINRFCSRIKRKNGIKKFTKTVSTVYIENIFSSILKCADLIIYINYRDRNNPAKIYEPPRNRLFKDAYWIFLSISFTIKASVHLLVLYNRRRVLLLLLHFHHL
jgi:hypothetical protein